MIVLKLKLAAATRFANDAIFVVYIDGAQVGALRQSDGTIVLTHQPGLDWDQATARSLVARISAVG